MHKETDWNKVWETEKDKEFWKTPDPDLAEFIRNLPRDITTVLDLGCGPGRHTIYCAKQGLRVTAADISAKAIATVIEWAEKEKLAVSAYVGDIFSDTLRDRKFDLILSINVIYHSGRQEIIRTLKVIRERLHPGGFLYLTFLSRDDDKYGTGEEIEPHTFSCTTAIHRGGVHYFSDEADIRDLLKDFTIVSLKKDNHEWKYEGKKRHGSFWKVACRLAAG